MTPEIKILAAYLVFAYVAMAVAILLHFTVGRGRHDRRPLTLLLAFLAWLISPLLLPALLIEAT